MFKQHLDAALFMIDWEGGIKDFLKLGVGSKKGGLYDNNKRINTLCELCTLIYFCVNMYKHVKM